MANAKITALTENATPIATDILPMVDDPGGSPITKKVTVNNLLASLNLAYQVTPTTAQTTTSTSFVDMTAGTQSVVLAVKSHVLVFAHSVCYCSSGTAYVQCTYDSGAGDTLVGTIGYNTTGTDGFTATCGGLVANLAAGTYTFAMMKKTSAGTSTFHSPSMSIIVIPAV